MPTVTSGSDLKGPTMSAIEVGNLKSLGKCAQSGSKMAPVTQDEEKLLLGIDVGREILFHTPLGSPNVTRAATLSSAVEETSPRALWATRAP